jgi:glycerophosphoryl diester phosphodiesterase
MPYLDGSPPRLFGHRGAAGVLPENTLVSFARALDDGARYLELDVHTTADGQVVVIHDDTVDRTTDGSGAVARLTLTELRRLDAGYGFAGPDGGHPMRGRGITVPTLLEVLDEFPGTPLNIEIKQGDPPAIEHIVGLLVRHGARERVLVATAEDDIMATLRPACARASIPTNFAAGEVAEFVGRVSEGRMDGYRPAGTCLQIPPAWRGIPLITAQSIDAAHAIGVEVHAWTINDRAEMTRLLALGVDGIMSDFPALARDVIAGR